MAVIKPVSRLRPHHLLCIMLFVGKGYSSDFSENMQRLAEALAADPAQQIELCSAADAICRCCPNRRKASCVSAEKVSRYDKSCLRALSLSEGDRLSWEMLSERVREQILRPGKRKTICRDCQWSGLCEQIEKRAAFENGSLLL